MIEIRTATGADAQSLSELNLSFNGIHRDAARVHSALQTDGSAETVLVAEESGLPVGFLCFQTLHSACYDLPWTEITELHVSPDRRRHGAGKALVREAIRQAREAGVSEILARTNINNDPAKRLFAQLGLAVAPHVVFRGDIEPAQPAAATDP